ncbi:MAG: ABC transporter substrate-binding protein [Candidatus Methylomirabilia bacterium]
MRERKRLGRHPLLVAAFGFTLAMGLVFAPAGRPEAAVTKVIITQAVESLAFVANYVARANGYFADEDLAVEVISTRGGGPDIKANLAGRVEFSIAAGTYQINAVKAGGELIAVMSALKRSIVNSAIRKDVAERLGITAATPFKEKLKKMKGLTLGATRPGALTYNQGEYWIRKAGYTPQQEVKLIGAGAGPVLVAALERGKIDVAIQTIPVPETAVFRGKAIPFITNSAGQDPDMDEFMMEVLLVRPGYAEKNPETVRKVVRALLRANRWIAEHSAEEIRERIQIYFAKTDPRLLRTSIGAVKTAVSLDGKITQRAVDITQNLLIAAGKLKKPFARSVLVSDAFLPR